MVLVALAGDAESASRALEARVDALLLTSPPPEGGRGETPWGMWLRSPEGLEALKGQGCDFVVLEGWDFPLEGLKEEGLGRLMAVGPDLGEDTARGMEALPLDGVVYTGPLTSPLSLGQLRGMASVRDLVDLAFLALVSTPFSEWELECIRDAGVNGLVFDLGQGTPEGLKALREGLDRLGPRRPRERPTALVPRVSLPGRAPEPGEEEEEEG